MERFFSPFLAAIFVLMTSMDLTSRGLPVPESNAEKINVSGNCDAPPPINLHLTDIGTQHLSIAWTPSVAGAIHSVELYESNGQGGWNYIYMASSILDSTYTASGLTPGTGYRFHVFTHCENGEQSSQFSIQDGITLIVELTTNGRIPTSFIEVEGCDIDYPNYKWMGFKVHKIDDPKIYNIFEITLDLSFDNNGEPTAGVYYIRRVLPEGIVAANTNFAYPNQFLHSLPADLSFKILHVLDNLNLTQIYIGNLFIHATTQNLHLCIDEVLPAPMWDQNYVFTLLKSEYPSIETIEDPMRNDDNQLTDVVVQNPFSHVLNITLPKINNNISVTLSTLEGKIVLSEEISNNQSSSLSYLTENLSTGFYLLKIINGHKETIHKVFKSN